MAIGKESHLIDTLKHLIALDFDTIVAYQASLDRIENQKLKRALQEFLTDHWRHTQELTPLVQELGGIAPAHADAMIILTKGKVIVGQLGGDRGILAAMHSNEEDSNSGYENACARLDLTPHVRDVLQRARADERRHKSWLAQVLGRSQQPLGARLHLPLGASTSHPQISATRS